MTNEITIQTISDDDLLSDKFHQFTKSGLNNYWLAKELYNKEEFEGDTFYTYPQFDNVMAAIGLHICTLPRLLGPREVKFLRIEMGASQISMAHKIGYADDQVISKAESLNMERYKPFKNSSDALIRFYYLLALRESKDVDEYLSKNANQLLDDVQAQHTVIDCVGDHLLVA
jgi:hypothetical protein